MWRVQVIAKRRNQPLVNGTWKGSTAEDAPSNRESGHHGRIAYLRPGRKGREALRSACFGGAAESRPVGRLAGHCLAYCVA
jgi:hypothetical protein